MNYQELQELRERVWEEQLRRSKDNFIERANKLPDVYKYLFTKHIPFFKNWFEAVSCLKKHDRFIYLCKTGALNEIDQKLVYKAKFALINSNSLEDVMDAINDCLNAFGEARKKRLKAEAEAKLEKYAYLCEAEAEAKLEKYAYLFEDDSK